jgi:hypothetical protein
MWKEKLPNNCPPNTATEGKLKVYRILKTKIALEEDFISYAKMYEDNPRYKELCKAYAISFYNNIENAKIALKLALARGNNIGAYIGEFLINETDGKNEITANSGHISTWFYNTWKLDTFNASLIIEINEN